jgi:hypothetical protein
MAAYALEICHVFGCARDRAAIDSLPKAYPNREIALTLSNPSPSPLALCNDRGKLQISSSSSPAPHTSACRLGQRSTVRVARSKVKTFAGPRFSMRPLGARGTLAAGEIAHRSRLGSAASDAGVGRKAQKTGWPVSRSLELRSAKGPQAGPEYSLRMTLFIGCAPGRRGWTAPQTRDQKNRWRFSRPTFAGHRRYKYLLRVSCALVCASQRRCDALKGSADDLDTHCPGSP